MPRFAPVEPKCELVETLPQVFRTDAAVIVPLGSRRFNSELTKRR